MVSHQIGHVLFLSGVIFLLYKTYQDHLRGKGWNFFKAFLWLIIGWNILTFTGHAMHELAHFRSMEIVSHDGSIMHYVATDFYCLIYYLAHLDHILLVPAFVCLYKALGEWEHGV